MWAVNHNYRGQTNTSGRQSFGVLHQPRLSWRNDTIDIGHAAYPSFAPFPSTGWIVDAPLNVTNEAAGAICLNCFLNTTTHRGAQITFGQWAARLRFIEGGAGAENGLPEFRSFARTGTVNYLTLELLEDGSVTQSRILHSGIAGSASLVCGFTYADSSWRFVAWAIASIGSVGFFFPSTAGESPHGAGTAVVAVDIGQEPDVTALQKTVEGSPSLRIVSAAEHYDTLPDSFSALPELPATIVAREGGPPGSLRQRQANALMPRETLERFDCGQMVELTRNNLEGTFFVQSLAAYDYSEFMPWLPPAHASNIHESAEINALMERLSVSSSSGPTPVICTNEGSGLNEYRGSLEENGDFRSFLIAIYRRNYLRDYGTPSFQIVTDYVIRGVVLNIENGVATGGAFFQPFTAAQMGTLFSGDPLTLGSRAITAIGPA